MSEQNVLAGESHGPSHMRRGFDPIPGGSSDAAIGDIQMWYGVAASLPRMKPGWKIMDGTVTLQDGTTPPDMRDRFPIGAGTTFALGATGGSTTVSHGFTQPSAHGITVTQPAAHVVTGPPSHNFAAGEFALSGGSGNWAAYTTGTQPATHDAARAHTPPSLTHNHDGADVTLTNNHSGGAVTDATGVRPPYVALHFIIRTAFL